MKTLISRYENTLYNRNKCMKMDLKDVNKIKEFQEEGNLFGLFVEQYDLNIEQHLKQIGINVDFMIKNDGTIFFKEGYQYFNYEPFTKEEIEMILSSVKGRYKVKVMSPKGQLDLDSRDEFNNINLYSGLYFYDYDDQNQIIRQLTRNYDDILSTTIFDNNIFVFSKKGSLDKSIEILCGLKKISIDDIAFFANCYENEVFADAIEHLYALEENNPINKEIYLVDSLGECVDDILEESNTSPFLSFFLL